MMASTHTYDLPGKRPAAGGAAAGGEGVEVALDPSELDLVDTDAMAQRYEERMRETQLEKEDLSDMVAEHAAKQKVSAGWGGERGGVLEIELGGGAE